MNSINIQKIIDTFKLKVVVEGDPEQAVTEYEVNRSGLQLTGFYGFFQYKQIQVLGNAEIYYLQNLSQEERRRSIYKLMSKEIPCLIIANKNEIMEDFIEAARDNKRWLLWSEKETSDLKVDLTLYLQNQLAESIQCHATLMDVYGVGVLITGESGIGKSETALALLQDNHLLVADDSVTIKRPRPDMLFGSGPELTKDLLEVRGIGILDIRTLYGLKAIRADKKIDIIVHLEPWLPPYDYDRLGDHYEYKEILGIKIPYIRIPVRPGRTIASIIEVAALNFRQNKLGINIVELLDERLKNINY
ncbi:MAG: HPr(Ser) kinase/phosphatase [Peptococcia bacterium]